MIIVDGELKDWHQGMTVASLLENMDNVRFCSVVRLNGKLVSSPKFSQTPIHDKDTIQLLPLVAGG